MKQSLILAMGVCSRDAELAAVWLRWTCFLAEQPNGAMTHVDMLVLLAMSVTDEQEAKLRASVSDWGRCAPPRVVFVRAVDEMENAYPKSASHLFLRTLETAERLYAGAPVLWVEADTVPLCPGWAREIACDYSQCGRPFMGMMVGTQFPHLSGNAVYPANWRTLAPSIANVLNAPDVKLWGKGRGQPWDVYCRHETTPQMAVTKLIFQQWKNRDVRPTRLKDIPPEACLFHQDKTGHVIREIAAARYPEFMTSLTSGRKFYLLNGPSQRLKLRGVDVKFSFEKYFPGTGWRSAVCSDELNDAQANAMAMVAGKLGVREITEAEFTKVTGRAPKQMPMPRVRPPARSVAVEVVTDGHVTHPHVFVMLGRYGDIINILPMLKDAADVGIRPTLVVAEAFADILDGVSYVDRVVWEGGYDRLPDALRWLRKSKGIPMPVVLQHYRHPTDKARLCSSYQLEAWRLGGRDFSQRSALVFDVRNATREADLVKRVRGNDTRPLILVGLLSHSSPLENENAIRNGVVACYQRDHNVIDLTTVQAERVYDLIALYDAAAVLIAADTMHLHLSRASTVPLVALLNDGWRGSIVEHAAEALRYSEAAPQAVVDAVTRTLAVGPGSRVKSGFHESSYALRDTDIKATGIDIRGPKIFHVVHMHGSALRHHVAQATWQMAYREGITPVHCRDYTRDAATEIKDPRNLPYLKDLLKAAMDQSTSDADIVAWSNSDIGFKSGLAQLLRDHVGKYGAASMRRTESNGKPHPGRDLVAFTVKWLRDHWEELPDYIIGAPVFDLGLVAMIRKHHGLPALTMASLDEDMHPAEMTPGYALHESHDPEWQVRNISAVPSVKHNTQAFVAWAKVHAPETRFSKRGNLL